MSSLSALNPTFRPNVARLAVLGLLATILVLLGFLIPFWMVLSIAAGVAAVITAVRAIRRASRTIDQILNEELDRTTAS